MSLGTTFHAEGCKLNALLSLMQLMSRRHGETVELPSTANEGFQEQEEIPVCNRERKDMSGMLS